MSIREKEPVFVTEIAERKPSFLGLGISMMSPIMQWTTEQYDQFLNLTGGKNPVFQNLKSDGVRLYDSFVTAFNNGNTEEAVRLWGELQLYTLKPYEEKTDPEKWAQMNVQMPTDWGPMGEINKTSLKIIMTSHARGRVLEPMSGFRTYFADAPHIDEVVALDFCREGLERYDKPERTRILYDMERVSSGGERMDFFGDRSFDTVGVCFGMDYMTDPVAIYKEFNRILRPGGKVLVVGGTTQGYEDLIKRWFDAKFHVDAMARSGLNVSSEELVSIRTSRDLGTYHLVVGRKAEGED